MSMVALAGVSLANLRVRAEVAKQSDALKRIEETIDALKSFIALAERWDSIGEPEKDLLRYLAKHLRDARDPGRVSWWRRQGAAFRFWLLTNRLGPQEALRLAAKVVSLSDDLILTVESFEERQNERFQEELAKAIHASLAPARKELTREQVSDFFKRLPPP